MKILEEKDFINKPSRIVKFMRGGLWEENDIEIQHDVPIYEADKVNCPHLDEKYIVRSYGYGGRTIDEVHANCPRVIVAVNEGGFSTTGVCLDCVLEQLKSCE